MTIKQTVATSSTKRAAAVSTRAFFDLIVLMTLALCLPIVVILPIPLIRVPLGLALVLLAPGYALSAALFARRDDLDTVTRLALSFGLSIASVPLLALALDLLPWGIRLWPMTIALAGWIGGWTLIATFRRACLLRSGTAMLPPAAELPEWWAALSSRQRLRYGGSLLFGGALLLWIVAGMPGLAEQAPATEFYVLGAQGLAEDYPREVAVGQEMQVTLGIRNNDSSTAIYRVEARAGGTEIARLDPVEVAAGQTWEQPLRYTLNQVGDDQQIDLLLFRANETDPHRRLRLWINVRETLP
ncbi:MAG TPA: DUF1616 domain-containing protein [Herpetosiphonaceae bacterium]